MPRLAWCISSAHTFSVSNYREQTAITGALVTSLLETALDGVSSERANLLAHFREVRRPQAPWSSHRGACVGPFARLSTLLHQTFCEKISRGPSPFPRSAGMGFVFRLGWPIGWLCLRHSSLPSAWNRSVLGKSNPPSDQ